MVRLAAIVARSGVRTLHVSASRIVLALLLARIAIRTPGGTSRSRSVVLHVALGTLASVGCHGLDLASQLGEVRILGKLQHAALRGRGQAFARALQGGLVIEADKQGALSCLGILHECSCLRVAEFQ